MQKEVLHNKANFKGYNGLELFYQWWAPKEPKASIVIVHGIGEHSSRYSHIGTHFSKLGYAVYAFDLRGNGRSSGKKGHINNFNEYVLDLKLFIEHLSLKDKPFILGHSLGGLVVIRFAMDYPEAAQGLILCAPALGLSMKIPLWKKAAAYGFQKIYPESTLIDTIVPTECISHDLKVCRAYDSDPLVHRIRSACFFMELVKTYTKTQKEPERLKTPSLFLQPGDDKITSLKTAEEFYEKVPGQNKAIKVYPNFYHEILNEVGKEEVFKDIETWLASLIGRLSV